MRSKPHPIMSSYGLCIVMLVALLTHANAIPADNSLTMTRSSPTISQLVAFNSSLDDTRAEHRLRTDTETMANDGDDNFEERLLEGIGLGTTRIRTVLETMMLKLKLLINKVMTKVGLTKQSKVDKFFERIVKESTANGDEIWMKEFKRWTTFTEKTYKDSFKDADAAMVTTLVKHYGDAPLRTMLIAMEENPNMELIARRLMKAQLTRWYTTRKSGDKVFKLLKLDTTEDGLLRNPMLEVWVSYLKMYEPEAQAKMAWPVLHTHYKDEANLAIMLAKAAKAPETDAETKDIVLCLMDFQFMYWKNNEGKRAADAFKLLKLDEAGNKLLENPMLDVWITYVKMYEPDTQAKMVWPVLLAHYKDEVTLATMLANAAKAPETETKDMAEWLMGIRFKHWKNNEGKSAADAFKVLKLDEAGDKLFVNPMLDVWVSYVKMYKPEAQAKMAWSVLHTQYKDEVILATMLANAAKAPETEDMASWLKGIRFTYWYDIKGKSAADVFKLLKLDEAGNKLLENPMLEVWISYVKTYEPDTQAEKAWPVLLAHYKKDKTITEVLLKAARSHSSAVVADWSMQVLFEHWYTVEKKSVKEAFTLLNLDAPTFSFIGGNKLNFWISYVERFDDETQIKDAWPLLLEHYKWDKHALAEKVVKAMKKEKTRPLAEKLLQIQFKVWRSEKKSDQNIYDLLQLNEEMKDTTLYKLWEEHTLKVKEDVLDSTV